MVNVHYFESTGEAYDACQCDKAIKTGDVLVIRSERVVGIADTWPMAVTAKHGELHRPATGLTVEQACTSKMLPGLKVARERIRWLGYKAAD